MLRTNQSLRPAQISEEMNNLAAAHTDRAETSPISNVVNFPEDEQNHQLTVLLSVWLTFWFRITAVYSAPPQIVFLTNELPLGDFGLSTYAWNRIIHCRISDHDTDSLNKLLAQGWRPVRETTTWSGGSNESGEQILVLLEREDELPIYSAESLPGGMLLEEFRENEIFSGCTDSEVREIVTACGVCEHAKGEVNFSEEDGRTEIGLFIILEGQVEVHLPNVDSIPTEETLIEDLSPGELFGEVSFFAETEHGGLVLAKSDVQTLCLRQDTFRHLLQSESVAAVKLVLNITQILAQRLHETDHWTWTVLQNEQDAKLANSWRKFKRGVRLPSDRPGSFFKASSVFE